MAERRGRKRRREGGRGSEGRERGERIGERMENWRGGEGDERGKEGE